MVTDVLAGSAIGRDLACGFVGLYDGRRQDGQKEKLINDKQTAAELERRSAYSLPEGPVYAYGEYMGDDPDPFIRLMLLWDAGARFDGAY